jgi:NifU-like protein
MGTETPNGTDHQRFLDHRDRPRNLGEVLQVDGVAEIVAAEQGRSIRVTFTLDRQEQILVLGYRTDARGADLAACSALSVLAIGKTLREVLAIPKARVLAELEPLPAGEQVSELLLQKALLEVSTVRRKQPPTWPDHHPVCWCFHRSAGELRKAIAAKGLRTVAQVREATGATGGCGSCRPDVERLLREHP